MGSHVESHTDGDVNKSGRKLPIFVGELNLLVPQETRVSENKSLIRVWAVRITPGLTLRMVEPVERRPVLCISLPSQSTEYLQPIWDGKTKADSIAMANNNTNTLAEEEVEEKKS